MRLGERLIGPIQIPVLTPELSMLRPALDRFALVFTTPPASCTKQYQYSKRKLPGTRETSSDWKRVRHYGRDDQVLVV
jgi:hypothetical protein